jgi:hypothetical protein
MSSYINFSRLSAGKYDVAKILAEIVRPEHTFPGYRKVLLAWLRAWVLAPEDTKLQRTAIRRRAVDIYDEGREEFISRLAPDNQSESERWSKDTLKKFRTRILEPSGAANKKARLISAFSLNSRLLAATRDLPLAIAMVAVWHRCATEGSKPVGASEALGNPSLIKTFPLIPKIAVANLNGQPIHRKTTTVRTAWEAHKRSIAFVYAASRSASTPPTLLHTLLHKDLRKDQIDTILHDWLGRSRYVATNILGLIPKPDPDWRADFDQLVDPVPFDPPEFSEAEVQNIIGAFPSPRARAGQHSDA